MLSRIRVVDYIKSSKFIYRMYFCVMSFFLRLIGLFVKADKKECLFVCYGGRKYGDNVKPIYVNMLSDPRFKDWKFVWAFRDMHSFEVPDSKRTKIVRIDSVSYFFHALRAKCWITNVSVQRGLSFKNKGTIYVNTWHGAPLKRIWHETNQESIVNLEEKFDLILAEGNYDVPFLERAFRISSDGIKITGYPRNDIMFERPSELKRRVQNKYNIGTKKIVLYAPTYREYNLNESGGFTFNMMLSAENFTKRLGDEYVLLIRAHGAIEDDSVDSKSCIDVTDYPEVEALLVAADILITDYSAIMFDFSLLEKPIICFHYDVDEYRKKRGFFVDTDQFLPFLKCYSEDEIYSAIADLDYDKECQVSRSFKEKCGLIEKGAAKNAVDEIYGILSGKQVEKG